MPVASTMPAPLRTAIEAELAGLQTARTEAGARRLSARYLADHPADSPIVATADDAAAYLTTRMPATFAAVQLAISQLRDAVPGLAPTSLLDLGSGTGAATWAAWEELDSLERADLVDYSRPMLAAAARMLEGSGLTVTTTLADAGGSPSTTTTSTSTTSTSTTAPSATTASSPTTTASTPTTPTHDLAVAAFVLSELTQDQQDAVLHRLTTAARQAVLVVEPGTPAGYRRILRQRDGLLARGWRIVAPCPHEHACPLLQADGSGPDGDWCHAAVRLARSRAHRQAKGGERGYEDEKLSYVAAVPGAAAGTAAADLDLPAARVLRHPLTHPGHIRLELCTSDGTHQQVTVTKRDKDAFRAARKVEWGQAWRA